MRRGATRKPRRQRPVRHQLQVLPAGLRPRHGARALLPELPQPPARDLGRDRLAGRHRQCLRRAECGGCGGAGHRARVCRSTRRSQRRPPSGVQRRPPAGGNLSRGARAGIRDHRREHAARGRRRHGAGHQHRGARVREDGALLHRVSGRHQAARPLIQYAAAAHAASRCRAKSPIGRMRRCSSMTWSCCSRRFRLSRRASRSCAARRCPTTCLPAAGARRCRAAISSARSASTRKSAAGTKRTSGRRSSRPPRPSPTSCAASQMVLVFEGGVTHIPGLEDKFTGGPAGPRPALQHTGHLGQRQPLELRRAGTSAKWSRRPLRRHDLVGLSHRRALRISERDRRLEPHAALLLAAGRERHHSRAWRQLHRRPLRPHARHFREPARAPGSSICVDQVRRRRPLQRSQRPRLRRGQPQISRSDRDEGNDHAQRIRNSAWIRSRGRRCGRRARLAAVGEGSGASSARSSRRWARRRPRNADGTIPAWNGGIKSAAEAGFPNYPPGPAPPGSVRERQAAVHHHAGEHGPVRGEAHRGAQEAAADLQEHVTR